MKTPAVLALVVALVTAACGGSTRAPAATTTATSSTPPSSTAGARFAVTAVHFGDAPMVIIENVGDETGSLAGHWLCQRPTYGELAAVEVAPGASVAVPVGGGAITPPPGVEVIEISSKIGSFDPTSGEVGLYSSSSFGSADAIVAYVEWGHSGHGRSGTAVAAGIWPEGGFVPTDAATTGIVAGGAPAGPDGWQGEN